MQTRSDGTVNVCIHTPTRKIEAPIRDRSESFGAVLGRHVRSQTTARRPHAAQMAYVQCLTTQAPPPRATIAHAALHNPPVPSHYTRRVIVVQLKCF